VTESVLLPAVVVALCAVLGYSSVRRYLQRRRMHELVWAVTFLSFGIAAACEVVGTVAGWSVGLTYLYYLTGRSLSVGFLAVGTLYLLVPRALANVALGVALFQALSMALLLLRLQPNPAVIHDLGWRALSNEASVRAIAMVVNYLGTVIVVVGTFGSAYSLWSRGMLGRAGGVLSIGVGTIVVAAGASQTARSEVWLYGGMALGLAIVFAGYRLVNARPVVQSAPVTVPAQSSAAGVGAP